MSVVCVCTQGFWSFRATSSLALQAQSCVLRLNLYLVFIPAPSMALLLYTSTLFADGGISWPELCGNLGVFIIQRPCSLCCFSKGGVGGEQRCMCVFGRGEMQGLTQCHWQGELQNPTVDFPPIICSSPGRHRQDHTGVELRVCVCVWHLYRGACVCVCVHLLYSALFAWAGTHLLSVIYSVAVCIYKGQMIAGWFFLCECGLCGVCARLSLTCHIAVCYYWPWQVSVEKAAFLLSQTESLCTKKSIPLICSTHLWFTPICIYPKHRIKSMKLITLSCCLSLTHTLPNTHTLSHCKQS